MKKTFFALSTVLFMSFSYANTTSSIEDTPLLKEFKKEHKNLGALLDLSQSMSSSDLSSEQLNSIKKEFNLANFEFLYVPIVENNVKKGAYLEVNGKALYLVKKEGSSYDVYKSDSNFSKAAKVNISFNSNTGQYSASATVFWCEAACTATALAIAAGDGPSPALDILAVAYQVACVADCKTR